MGARILTLKLALSLHDVSIQLRRFFLDTLILLVINYQIHILLVMISVESVMEMVLVVIKFLV